MPNRSPMFLTDSSRSLSALTTSRCRGGSAASAAFTSSKSTSVDARSGGWPVPARMGPGATIAPLNRDRANDAAIPVRGVDDVGRGMLGESRHADVERDDEPRAYGPRRPLHDGIPSQLDSDRRSHARRT